MSALQLELPDARVLDLFAGSGALGLEALSRGARHAVFVERSGRAVRVLERNIQELGAMEAVQVVRRDVFQYLDAGAPLSFDLALADPPYGQGLAWRLAQRFLQNPFARQLWVEHRVDEELPEGAVHRRRYGDTGLTAYLDPRNAGNP